MTSRRLRYAGAVVLIVSLAGASFALASGGHKNKGSEFHAKLIGYNEVPSLNTPGHATLALTVTDTTITFKLDYADLTGPPGAAHIHIGQRASTVASRCSSAAAEASRPARRATPAR